MKIERILIISDSIDVNDSSASKGRVALINNLNSLGYQLKVLHFTQKIIKLNGIDCISIPEKKYNLTYLLSRSQRVFTRFTKINFNPFIERLLGFSFTFFNDTNSIKKAILKEMDFQPDLVLTLSKGASFRSHYAVLQIPALHAKWMAYVHDPYPYHYYPRPYNWVESGYQQKERFFRAVSEKAAYSAFPSELLREWMGSYFPNFLKTGVVIPHQNSEVGFTESELPEYFNQSKFTILHAGALIKPRSPEGLIKGFKLFLKKNIEAKDKVQLILLGNASYHKQLLDIYAKELPQLYFNNKNEKFNIVYKLQQTVSVNVILESKSEISPFLPGKFPHCIEANKPILLLAPFYSETRRLLGDDYFYTSEVDDSIKISILIEKLYNNWLVNPNSLKLNRRDLNNYISENYLKSVLESIKNNN
ncbi:UDP-glycosyltransferase [Lutibacter sp. HS1-25]|uniref:UDP-glycosyltransferase n=1 Tax=Lutibacter sp. HS1-25 TaxID=2485000 RepID=UPI0010137063|nr:UDP-glycosyltransferase [Lutibacter sp. HS1-25]RXP52570.1 UDP-glycosyltransferase [Lutibacter sp. HS1-25]